jgi:hypothetical protein
VISEPRSFLFLQGLASWFFDRLGRALAHGASGQFQRRRPAVLAPARCGRLPRTLARLAGVLRPAAGRETSHRRDPVRRLPAGASSGDPGRARSRREGACRRGRLFAARLDQLRGRRGQRQLAAAARARLVSRRGCQTAAVAGLTGAAGELRAPRRRGCHVHGRPAGGGRLVSALPHAPDPPPVDRIRRLGRPPRRAAARRAPCGRDARRCPAFAIRSSSSRFSSTATTRSVSTRRWAA